LDLFPFDQDSGRSDFFRSDHSPGDEGLRTHEVNCRFRER
jgi:hypothetical protein